jgi:8-oxo-dGTP diphosphatase
LSDSREYPSRPICGVGAVVRKGDSVLLIQRGREPRLGQWTVPGGAVELGESLRDAAVREIREECGIEIRLGQVMDAFDIMSMDQAGQLKYHYIVVDLAATYTSGDLRPGGDVVDARWVGNEELDKYQLDDMTRKEIKRVLNDEVKMVS